MIKNNETGRSMIEMLGVLAIIGVLSVGGIAGYSKAMMKYRINKSIEQISMIVTNVRTLFGTQKNYLALGATTNSSLIAKARLFPDELLNGTNNVIAASNPFGGNIELYAGARASNTAADSTKCAGCGDARAFVLAFYNIPEEACMDLATQDWGSASGSGLIKAQVVSGIVPACTAGEGDCTETVTGTLADFAKVDTDCSKTTIPNGIACPGKGPMAAASAAAICENDSNVLFLKFY